MKHYPTTPRGQSDASDHSYTCGECGCERGGMNHLSCACDLQALANGGVRDALASQPRDDRSYERDPIGLTDKGAVEAPAKPCSKRHNWTYNGQRAVTWCTRPDGHGGLCQTPPPGVIESDDLGPGASKRRRW